MKKILLFFVLNIFLFSIATKVSAICSGMVQCEAVVTFNDVKSCSGSWGNSIACSGTTCSAACALAECEISNGCTGGSTGPAPTQAPGAPIVWAQGPDCPAGSVRTATVVGTNLGGTCGFGSGYFAGATGYRTGTKETKVIADANCCKSVKVQDAVCGDFYCFKWNQFNQCTKMKRDCIPEVWECRDYNVLEYSCTSTCDDTSPSNVSITNGPTAGTTATVTWTPGLNGTSQKLYVDQNQAEVVAGCTTPGLCEANLTLTAADNTETITGLLPSTTYYFRVVTYSSASCNSGVNASFTTPANAGIVSGKVYFDTTNSCDTTAFPGQTVRIDGTNPGAVTDAAGAFSLNGSLAGVHTLDVTIPNGYTCSTGAGCNTCSKTGVISPSANNYFYLTLNRSAWWQTKGAGVYAGSSAGGSVISSIIPDSIVAGNKYLSSVLPAGGTGGVVVRASGDAPSLGAGSVNALGWSAKSTYKGKRADYAYFSKEMGLTNSVISLSNLSDKPSTTADFHYINAAGTVSNPWNVANGEKYVIFVNGDLNLNANITVANGGFLAFVVKGNVVVASGVTSLDGIYVADNNFVSLSAGSDVQLTVNGSVVVWGDIDLGRDLIANNSNIPAELFNYRPDLLVSMPDKMKSFVMEWSEVVPGTYASQ